MLLETERRERRYKIYQLMDDLSTIPDEAVGTAYKNILSESLGIIMPVSEKTEAVIRAENIILKATLEMEV
nr:MAG TPA_asm: hypothetical protein [Caudoviricetes sp.]